MNTQKNVKMGIIALMAAATVATACKKTSGVGPDKVGGSSDVSLLTTGTWKISKVEFDEVGGTWGAVDVPDYEKGETLAFNADNTYIAVSPSSSASGNWKLSADNSQLTMVNSKGNSGGTLALTALSGTTLQLTDMTAFSVLSGPTDPVPYHYYSGQRDTFVH